MKAANAQHPQPKPILLKIAPDLSNGQLDDIIEIVRETQIEGVIATNTTLDRSNLSTDPSNLERIGAGGVSGKALEKGAPKSFATYTSSREELFQSSV